MILNYDYFKTVVPPDYVLCKANGDRLGIIQATDKKMVCRFNSYQEISFTTYMYIDGVKNSLYDNIVGLQHIELPSIGRFVINNVSIHSEATDFEYKECTALSEEVLLAQKYIDTFFINMGTVESIDGVRFYHQSNPAHSLLHLLLEKCPDWEIGHIDVSLMGLERCFEIDRQDIYSTLVNDISTAFQCIFSFDTIHHRINVYAEDNVGEDTNIFISFENLLKSTDISYSIDNIKTCLTVTGADDLNLREVNMGYDTIYNLEYFNSLEYMSQQLYNEYNAWKTKWNNNVANYESLVVQYQQYYNQIHKLESEKMPSKPESTNWTEYGLNPLKEQLEVYKQKQALMMKSGQGDKSHRDYQTVYLPCYNTIQAIEAQLKVVEKELSTLRSRQKAIGDQMDVIINNISMQNNFSPDSLKELVKWIREGELNSDNFVVTDSMTDVERMDMLHEMLEYGRKELARVSQPELEFRADIANLYNIPEFKNISVDFDPGNYIHVYIRDDYIIKARLLTVEIDWLNPDNFAATFGNVMKLKGSTLLENVTEALGLAQSVTTSVSMNASNWNKANKEASDIMEMLSNGLAAAGQVIETSASDVLIDDRGILVSNIPESLYPYDRIFIGGSQILFSDDNFKTVRTGIGRLTYTKKGVTYNDFGVLADFVIAGYIAGSVIEGDEIIGGTIVGTDFNNGNGTFHVDSEGNLTATSADIKGTIKADKGYIGGKNGFTIESGKLYSGETSTFSSAHNGVYIGNDGISLGAAFKATPQGKLTCSDIDITGGSLKIGDNFEVTNKGNLTAKNANFSGSITSSSFKGGSININDIFKVDTAGNTSITGNHFSWSATNSSMTKDGTLTCNNLKATNGTFSGDISGSNITGGKISGSSISAGTISGSTISGTSISGGTITGTSISAGNSGIRFSANTSKIELGDFEVVWGNGRQLFQSQDECNGLSTETGGGRYLLWAGCGKFNDYAINGSNRIDSLFLVNTTQVRATHEFYLHGPKGIINVYDALMQLTGGTVTCPEDSGSCDTGDCDNCDAGCDNCDGTCNGYQCDGCDSGCGPAYGGG